MPMLAHRLPMPKVMRTIALVWALLAAFARPSLAAEADVTLSAGRYEVVAQTLLPNLEENLRYATTRSLRCLGNEVATTLFPILLHPAFTGCQLVGQEPGRDELRFTLQCANPEAATGSALLLLDVQRFDGTLDIKMGAKNMTLSQRISGEKKGDCAKAP
jgi:hypothetical protein